MNNLSHLKKLAQVKSNAGVKFLTPAAYPGNHCPLHTSLALCSNISGMSSLVVGTPECANYSRNIVARMQKGGGLQWSYVLDGNEVVFGCRAGIIDALVQMDKAGAAAIVVIMTCIPEVIGEDIEGIVHELAPQLNAKINFVRTGHFKCNSHPQGQWKTMCAFGDMMPPPAQKTKTVNVLGRSPEEDHVPMPHMLAALEKRGYKLRLLAPRSDINDFLEAPEAALNLVVSPLLAPLAEKMHAEWGIPFILLHEIFDTAEIENAYNQTAKILGFDWNGEFDVQKTAAEELEAQTSPKIQGLKYIAASLGPISPLPMAVYLTRFKLEPILLNVEEFYPNDLQTAKILTQAGYNPYICHLVNRVADTPVLESLGADFCFGEISEGTGKTPDSREIIKIYGQIGYERNMFLLRLLGKISDFKGGCPSGNI